MQVANGQAMRWAFGRALGDAHDLVDILNHPIAGLAYFPFIEGADTAPIVVLDATILNTCPHIDPRTPGTPSEHGDQKPVP